ncbi:MAG: A/G-specific adenine glycosylase [bacterium]
MIKSSFHHQLTKKFTDRFRRRLLHWYGKNQRSLPWRRTQDPYRIWVSETMLQQTQVFRVKEYYDRFVTAFPDVEVLARSPLSKVLKMWEGLGYYSRARDLHRAAAFIANEHHGLFPQTFEEISALPGVGPYTAAAVMSIAYDQPYPVVDGNVTRVLCRVFDIEKDPRGKEAGQQLHDIAAALLPRRRAGVFNQALMELGSLVCRPTDLRCSECCLRPLCYAQTLPDPTVLPVKTKKAPKPHYDVTAGVIWKDQKILLAQRHPKGMLGGLWEFPGGKREPNESLKKCLRREIKEELGIDIEVKELIGSVRHSYSHFRITLHGFHCRHLRGRARPLGCADWKWISPPEVSAYALPGADRKLLEVWRRKKRG